MMSAVHEWIDKIRQMDLEQMQGALEGLSAYGPLPGILATFLETFIPVLPLIAIIAANVNIYGFGLGFLWSWIGVSSGKLILFLLCRYFGKNVKTRVTNKFPKSERFFKWIDEKGFTPLFLLSGFPFTPSILITLIAGFSRVPLHTFLLATMMGKAVMILIIALLSMDITNLMQQPWRFVVIIVVIAVMWFGGKKIEGRYQLNS
ncbi:TVP38/TMEM64 family protein [Paenibacillus yanchengensis]|uniref:TVP38/TMEM64 family membrane protein n=1 Tax=Paenibacillus yanchengensis TaxID=2035833 RepID=A0ABW4YGJ4_9BACL